MHSESYRKAVEQMWLDGKVVAEEIAALCDLQTQLGLSGDAAVAVEREVMGMTKEEALVAGLGVNTATPSGDTAPPAPPPLDPTSALDLGIDLLEAGDSEEADEQFTYVLQHDRENATAWVAKAAVATEEDLSKALHYLARTKPETFPEDRQKRAGPWFVAAFSEVISKHNMHDVHTLTRCPEVLRELEPFLGPAVLEDLRASAYKDLATEVDVYLDKCREHQDYHEKTFSYHNQDVPRQALEKAASTASDVLELDQIAWQLIAKPKRRQSVMYKLQCMNPQLLDLNKNRRTVDRMVDEIEQDGDADLASQLRSLLAEDPPLTVGEPTDDHESTDADDQGHAVAAAVASDDATVTPDKVLEQALLDMEALIDGVRGFGSQTTRTVIRALPPGEAFFDAFEERGGARLLDVPGIGEAKASALIREFNAQGGKAGMLSDARTRLETAAKRTASRRKWRPRLLTIVITVWLGVAAWWSIEDSDTSFWVALGWPLYLVLGIIALVLVASRTTHVSGYRRSDGTYVRSHTRSS